MGILVSVPRGVPDVNRAVTGDARWDRTRTDPSSEEFGKAIEIKFTALDKVVE
jgi:hypothetical protein